MGGMNDYGTRKTGGVAERGGMTQARKRKGAALLSIAALCLTAVVGWNRFGRTERPPSPAPAVSKAASLYRGIQLGMSRAQVERIAGQPKADASGLALFQLLEYPCGSECVSVQMDQINADHTWRVSDVRLLADVSPAWPFGVLRRIKYGPVPACPLCSR